MRHRLVRLDPNGLTVLSNGLVELALAGEGYPQVVVSHGEIRIDPNCPTVLGNRELELSLTPQCFS